jgi:hypothetical protein
MDRMQIESRIIRSIGYEPNSATLEIEFEHGGIYRYFDVPALVYEQLMASPSKGAAFHEFVREAGYKYVRVR